MPAPSMDELMEFEGNFELAAATALATSGVTAFIEATQAKLPLIYTGIGFDAGTALDDLTFTPKPAGWPVDREPPQDYFHYDGTLDFRISVPRDKNASPNPDVDTLMGFCRARIRGYFRLSVGPFVGLLPYYRVSSIRPLGSQHGYEAQRNIDFQNLRFGVRWAIVPDAWPLAGG